MPQKNSLKEGCLSTAFALGTKKRYDLVVPPKMAVFKKGCRFDDTQTKHRHMIRLGFISRRGMRLFFHRYQISTHQTALLSENLLETVAYMFLVVNPHFLSEILQITMIFFH